MNEEEAELGAQAAMSMIHSFIEKGERFDLIIEMSNYLFDNLDAHKIWSQQFKQQKQLTDNVDKVALIGQDTEKLKAEKELKKQKRAVEKGAKKSQKKMKGQMKGTKKGWGK